MQGVELSVSEGSAKGRCGQSLASLTTKSGPEKQRRLRGPGPQDGGGRAPCGPRAPVAGPRWHFLPFSRGISSCFLPAAVLTEGPSWLRHRLLWVPFFRAFTSKMLPTLNLISICNLNYISRCPNH